MATKVLMPQLGESVVEGIVGKWLKNEGERIERYEPLLEVITDKVDVEVPSPVSGVLQKIIVPEGVTVRVGEEMAIIEELAESADGRTAAIQQTSAVETTKELEELEVIRQRATPAVRRLAQEHRVDLSQIKGTGHAGRVTREDVERFLAERRRGADQTKEEAAPRSEPSPALAGRPDHGYAAQTVEQAAGEQEELPLTPMRRLIAEHMVRSKQTAPHAWTMFEVDVTKLVRLRESIKEEFRQREGADLTYLPFTIKAVVGALKEYPAMNASWGEDKILLKKRINIGVAVALDDGLIVPVLRDADTKSIAGLAKALGELVSNARAGKLYLADVQGGTFTVNNTGAFGSIVSMPIINQPQAAILTTEAITKRPVVIDDAIAIRSIMNMCISFDHRVLDGATVGRFMQRVKALLESMGPDTPLY